MQNKQLEYVDYSEAAHKLFAKCFGEKLAHDLKSPAILKSIDWDGLEITDTNITTTKPNIAGRFSDWNIEYMEENQGEYDNMLECFIQSVFDYGYQMALDGVKRGRVIL